MKLLIPLILLLIGLGGGVGAGLALRSAPETAAQAAANGEEKNAGSDAHAEPSETRSGNNASSDHSGATAQNLEYIKLNNQFVVPIVTKDSVDSIIVMSLSLEIVAGQSEIVYLREPKLRDEFLRVLFDHANMGGFRGTFTDTGKLESLRTGLLQVAQNTLGSIATAVLITDITRQDL